MPTNTKSSYLQELDRLEKPIRDAFFEYVAITVANTSVAAVERAVASGDTAAVMAALRINEAALSEVVEQIRNAYIAGGRYEAPNARIVFNVRSTSAEQWVSQHAAQFVTLINTEQAEIVRGMIEEGIRIGRGPRQTALDIVGRVQPSGRRGGGVVGLSGPQAKYVMNARDQLRTGDYAGYLTRTRRDKRFDATIKKAMRDNTSLRAADIDRITGRYADRLLQTRGEAIARTESITAFNAGRSEAVSQAIGDGILQQDLIVKTWVHAGVSDPRDDHVAMNGQQRSQDAPFEAPSGARMMFPGDTSLGAGPGDIINCRCFMRLEYDFVEAARRGLLT